ncbi:HAEPLYID family protein, partial [Pedobacter sp.]|uniref:HAEPLYID family protein n=1 Tax=Pedobacter sp. TaxID=1411316 RepID=UPI003D7FC1AD
MRKVIFNLIVFTLCSAAVKAQDQDSLPLKIKHAEPVYNDIVRDLGARKGEREINIGYKMDKNGDYSTQKGFIEYEFAIINRLGLELEIPFQFQSKTYSEKGVATVSSNKVESIKPAIQYTFFVDKKSRISMAAAGIYELKLHSFKSIKDDMGLMKGNSFNPFLIVAKRWGSNFHTMVTTGPEFYNDFETHRNESAYLLNVSMHYMIDSHFLGIEMNQEYKGHETMTVLRPQAKVQLNKNIGIGLVSGIPISRP